MNGDPRTGDRLRGEREARTDAGIRVAGDHRPGVVEERVVGVAQAVEDARLPRDADPGAVNGRRGDISAVHAVGVHEDKIEVLRPPGGRIGAPLDHMLELGVDVVEVRVDVIEREPDRVEHRRQGVGEQIAMIHRMLLRPARPLKAVDVIRVLGHPRSGLDPRLVHAEVRVVLVQTRIHLRFDIEDPLNGRGDAREGARQVYVRAREPDRHVEDVPAPGRQSLHEGALDLGSDDTERHGPPSDGVLPHVPERVDIPEDRLVGLEDEARCVGVGPEDDRILRVEEGQEQILTAVRNDFCVLRVPRGDLARDPLTGKSLVVVLHGVFSLKVHVGDDLFFAPRLYAIANRTRDVARERKCKKVVRVYSA